MLVINIKRSRGAHRRGFGGPNLGNWQNVVKEGFHFANSVAMPTKSAIIPPRLRNACLPSLPLSISAGRSSMMLRIFRHFVPMSVVLLAFCEISLLFFVWHFYLMDNHFSNVLMYDMVQSPSLRLALLTGAVMVASGLYHTKVFTDIRVLAIQIAITFAFLFAVVWALYCKFSFSMPNVWDIDEKTAVSWLLCILFTRTAFLQLADLDVFKRHVLVLGTGRKAARIEALARERSHRHFVAVGYLCCGRESTRVPAAQPATIDCGPNAIARRARELRATEIVVAADDRRGLPLSELLQCRAAGIRVVDYLDFIERETKTVDLAALQPGWLIFSDGFKGSRPAKACKRCFDVVLSLAVLLFALPLMLLTAVLIVLDSPGPVLYRQERVGLGGRIFVLFKFRSMRVDAEKDGAPRWALTADPRVTRVGSIIRKLRIDELPQLLNVLRGEMSFVGPRPERPAFVADLTKQLPFYAERHCVKPGITGWAQINFPYGASLDDARKKLSYDLYYVKNHGLFLDMLIVLHTIRVILWADGAR